MKIKCPSCAYENIEGEDRCAECFYSLMQRDIPRPRKSDTFQQALMRSPVSDLISGGDLLVAKNTDSIAKIVNIMKKTKKSCMLIYKEHKLVGILSERTLLNDVAGNYKDLEKVYAEDVMTREPEYIKAGDPISVAVNKMALGGFRHVPILADDGSPVAILTIKQVLIHLMQNREAPKT